ncbi:hypothetical protein PS900_03024 [Pseudomonas fluorescens]|jgi:hypothetical protein|uniref:Uncharacterized protein n=1 Tax=Pseudomonas fluorescens TaxID=294 RepID=A0A8H2NSD5_PSEFL|nr:hypothetical protein [Pseudomonas fluorescens]VVP04670.1 hypothetical protein PS900_03024 [Pseudomonas fluorescens]
MSWEEVFKLFGAAIFSLGGGGVIVFALSSWLGKIWAGRILAEETHQLSTRLEETKRDLDVLKEKTLRFQNDKILAYREITEIIAKLLAIMDAENGRIVGWDTAKGPVHEFNEQRLKLYGYLAMLAPQAVMDAQDDLVDHLLLTASGDVDYKWSEVREKVLFLLNAVREDIGLAAGSIVYKGKL